MKESLCRGCNVVHDPLWRCTDPRIERDVVNAPVVNEVNESKRKVGSTYNPARREYFREYMAKRRARASGGAT